VQWDSAYRHLRAQPIASPRGASDASITAQSAAHRSYQRTARAPPHRTGVPVNLHLALTPAISLVAGILILVMPKLLNFIVAVYLILIGLVGLFGTGAFH
jgi:Protein of unknown function (DUF3096)